MSNLSERRSRVGGLSVHKAFGPSRRRSELPDRCRSDFPICSDEMVEKGPAIPRKINILGRGARMSWRQARWRRANAPHLDRTRHRRELFAGDRGFGALPILADSLNRIDSVVTGKPENRNRWPIRRRAFTLIELVTSIAIIAALIALLLPAVQSARASARSVVCRNNLKQIALALHNYESVHKRFPPTFFTTTQQNAQGTGASWSVHGRLLPFLEQSAAYERIDLDRDWHFQVESGVTSMKVPTYLCPSEVNDRIRYKDGSPYVAPHTYGVNFGTWFIYDPKTESRGDGALTVNRGTRCSAIRDGLSHTLAIAEVKAYQPYLRNTTAPTATPPINTSALMRMSGQFKETGHTVWPDGRVHHSGITTTFTPNSRVLFRFNGKDWDIDFNSQQEGKSDQTMTYAAITSRSYHAGLVNTALLDGSVRTVTDSIDHALWRAIGTRDGAEHTTGF